MAVALVSTPLAARQVPGLPSIAGAGDLARYAVHREPITPSNRSPIDLVVVSKPDARQQAPAVIATATQAIAKLDDWLGPAEFKQLTIVDLPWRTTARDLAPGVLVIHSRWQAPARDKSLERELITGLVRQYWPHAGDDWFREALVQFTGGRAIDVLLEGSQFHSDRYLGGFLAHPIRSVPLSPMARDSRPRLRRYDELQAGGPADAAVRARAARAADALAMAERYLGWPAFQQALSEFRARVPASGSMAEFAAIASEQAGRDLNWLFVAPIEPGATFDYAVSGLQSSPSSATAGQYDVRVTVNRQGSAVFGPGADAGGGSPAGALTVETRFADGTLIRDWWDGKAAVGTLDYVSATPAVSAAIDPEVIVLLDEQRANNRIAVTQPWSRLAARLALNWAIWLQNTMLTYSSIV
jgi:hypothetical protein